MSFLQHLYKSMPAVPSLVYLARKMNIMQGREDTIENGFTSLADVMQLLLLEDFATLEEAHFKHTSADKPEIPNFLKEKADRVHAQLALINELDQKLTNSLRGLEQRVAKTKETLAEGSALSTLPAESVNFESLFEDQPLILGEAPEDLDDAVQLELGATPPRPVLKRSVAIS